MPSAMEETVRATAPYSSLAPVVGLLAATVTPLALTCLPAEKAAFGSGCVLALVLTRMTFDPPGAALPLDKAKEAQAISNVVLTSSGNRASRLLLGSVYIYAAVTFALRMCHVGPAEEPLLAQLLAADAGALGNFALAWIGAVVDLYIAGIWLSSGADGQ